MLCHFLLQSVCPLSTPRLDSRVFTDRQYALDDEALVILAVVPSTQRLHQLVFRPAKSKSRASLPAPLLSLWLDEAAPSHRFAHCRPQANAARHTRQLAEACAADVLDEVLQRVASTARSPADTVRRATLAANSRSSGAGSAGHGSAGRKSSNTTATDNSTRHVDDGPASQATDRGVSSGTGDGDSHVGGNDAIGTDAADIGGVSTA